MKTFMRNRKISSVGTMLGFALVGLVGILALAGGVFEAVDWAGWTDPEHVSFDAIHRAPGSPGHPLGTDDQGRDCLARVTAGALRTIGAAMLAAAVSAILGVPAGLAGGFWRGADLVLSRVAAVAMAFPALVLAIAIVSAMGAGLATVASAAGIVNAPAFFRLVRARVLVERQREYVLSARALGIPAPRILFAEILPNALTPALTLTALVAGAAILEIAGLGFLGLGVEPGTPEWGTDIAANRNQFLTAPWTLLAPGAALALSVLGFNLLGNHLEAKLNRTERE